VVSLARRRPDALVVGVDAGPDAMRSTAQRAARKPAKGGVPNALFVWAAVEELPAELTDVTEVHALMPWGSLLRALVAPDERVLRDVARRCRPGAPRPGGRPPCGRGAACGARWSPGTSAPCAMSPADAVPAPPS